MSTISITQEEYNDYIRKTERLEQLERLVRSSEFVSRKDIARICNFELKKGNENG